MEAHEEDSPYHVYIAFSPEKMRKAMEDPLLFRNFLRMGLSEILEV